MSWSDEYQKLRESGVAEVHYGKNYKKTKSTTAGSPTKRAVSTSGVVRNATRKKNKTYAEEYATLQGQEEERTWFKEGDESFWQTVLGTASDVGEDLLTGLAGIPEQFVDAVAKLSPYFTQAQINDMFLHNPEEILRLTEENERMQEQVDAFVAKDLYDEQKVAQQILAGLPTATENASRAQGGGVLTLEDLARQEQSRQQNLQYIQNEMEDDSVLGDKSDALVQSAGQLAGQFGLSLVGVPWWVTSGATSFGGQAESALLEGATSEEATASALISAGAEVFSEKFFGGDIFVKGGFDGVAKDFLSREISNKALRTLMKLGWDMAGEGFEELFSEAMGNLGSLLYKDEGFMEVMFGGEAGEAYLESFIGGAVLGGLMGGINVAQSSARGVDYTTELTANEQKVVDKVYKDRLAEHGDKKLTNRQKQEIYNRVLEDMDKGYISTDIIEEVLGGESYESYRRASEREQSQLDEYDALDKEYQELRNMKRGDMTGVQQSREAELAELREQIKKRNENISRTSTLEQMREQLHRQTAESVSGDRLMESYRERARGYENYQVDESITDGLAHQDAAKRTLESVRKASEDITVDGEVRRGLSNTNQNHDFFDTVIKLSGETGIVFELKGNEDIKNDFIARQTEKIKELQGVKNPTAEQAKELKDRQELLERVKSGETIVHGYIVDGGVALNLNSPRLLSKTIGHEITHSLERNKSYDQLRDAIFAYAKTKGVDIQKRLSELELEYAGVEGANPEAELVADLVGEYLFTDSHYVKSLYAENRNLFQRIWDEIKHLCKLVTAGSREARQLETVRKRFEDAFKEGSKKSDGSSYSLTPVEAVQPTTGKWRRGANTDEVRAEHPTLYAVDEDATTERNPTQVKGTIGSYRKVYNHLKAEGFDGTILDASSGLGYGTKAGVEEYGFDVEDIEPYPDKDYTPKYTDYSSLNKQYDVIISNAVLNVIPQDQRDALVVKMGELLSPGGRMFINVRGKDVLNASGKIAIDEANMEYFIPRTAKTGSYQKGFTKAELVAYLQDALGDGYTVKPTNLFGAVSAIVQKDSAVQYSLSENTGEYAPTFYSQMARVVDGFKQEKIGASTLVSSLRGKGVKAEEIKWSGIEEWLDGRKSVTKAELQEFIKGSQLQIDEQTLDETVQYTEEQTARVDEITKQTDELWDEAMDLWDKLFGEDFPSEIALSINLQRAVRRRTNDANLFTDDAFRLQNIALQIDRNNAEIERIADSAKMSGGSAQWGDYKLNGGTNYREFIFKIPGSSYSNEAMSTHWGFNNRGVLAHARVQDFDTPGGRMLFVEEIQSDWHNQGQKSGYSTKDVLQQAKLAKEEYRKLRQALVEDRNGLLSDLVNFYQSKGYDAPQQAANHDLQWHPSNMGFFHMMYQSAKMPSELVERIDSYQTGLERMRRLGEEQFHLEEIYKRGVPDAPFSRNYHEFVLKRLIREAAEKGYDSIGWTTADIQSKRWSDQYAEGYRIEYDQDIPSYLKKYGKKWGATVGKTALKSDTEVWTMPITPAMRQAVLYEGQPQYSLSSAKTDKMYLDAVKKGDMKSAQELADYTALQNGYTLATRYHQTASKFTRFNTDNPVAGRTDSETPNGMFFKTNDHDIGLGGDIQMKVYLKTENVLHFRNRKEANAWYCKNVPGYDALQKELDSALKPFLERLDDIEAQEFASNDDAEVDRLFEEEDRVIEEMKGVEDSYRLRLREILNDYFLTGKSGYDGIELDYDGHRWVNGKREDVHTIIVFDPAQVKSADPVTYDDSGNVIPLSRRFNTESADIRYSMSSMAYTFYGDENMSAQDFRKKDYRQTEGYKKYVADCMSNMRQSQGANFNEVTARQEIEDSIEGIIKVAVAAKAAGYDIPDFADRRNIRDRKKRLLFSSLEPNSDYITSSDISTICDKRKSFQEIYDDIVRLEEARGVPLGERFFSDVSNYFILHAEMAKAGLTTPCQQCYVESMRKNLGPMAENFITLVQEENGENAANPILFDKNGKKANNAKLRSRVRKMFTDNPDWAIKLEDLTPEMLSTSDGLTTLRLQAPLVYEAFNSFYGQAKPKLSREATPFRFGELTAMLTDSRGKIKKNLIEKINHTGGFRLQSYSDFQIQNFTDVLQVLFEAGTLGLKGHAYTKVPAFLEATKGTNLKRNISIFMYKDGTEWKLDRGDSFPYNLEEIYDIVRADESGNTGIIAVSQNAEMSAWIMANPMVGYGIPFHKSGIAMPTVRETIVREGGREIKGYTEIKDHTKQQSEVWKSTETKVKKGIDIYKFWDFDNKDGLSQRDLIVKNVKAYVDACEKAGYIPKFREYIRDNGKVLADVLWFSKQMGAVPADATIDDICFEYKGYRIPYGYYKFLGDFGMFKPNGEASSQEVLSLRDYDFGEAERFFEDSEALRRNEILQQFANGDVREEYRQGDLTTEQLEEIARQKRRGVVESILSKESLSPADEDVAPIGHDVFGRMFSKDIWKKSHESEAPIAPYEEAPVAETADIAEFPDSISPEAELATLTAHRDILGEEIQEFANNADFNNVDDQQEYLRMSDEWNALDQRIAELESELEQADDERLSSLDDSDIPPEIEAPISLESRNYDPYEGLSIVDITRSTRTYSDMNPGAREYIEQAALGFLSDVNNSTHGERWFNEELHYATNGEKGFFGTKRRTTDDIADIKDTYGYSWDALRKAAEDVVKGEVRSVLAKRVEYLCHYRLMEGYKDVEGRPIPANREYISFLNEQFASEQRAEGFEQLLTNGDQYAPPEDVAPVAPTEPVATSETPTYPSMANGVPGQTTMFAPKEPNPGTASDIAPIHPSKGDGVIPGQTSVFEPPKPSSKVATVRTTESGTTQEKSNILRKIIAQTVDKGMVFEDLSYESGNHELQSKWNFSLPSYTRARAQYFMEKGADGVKSLKDIMSQVPKKIEGDFFNYLYHVHNIDRMTLDTRFHVENKTVFGETVTADVSRQKAQEYLKAHPEFKTWAEDVYAYNRYLRNLMVKDGIISQKTADLWEKMYPHYVPIRRKGDTGVNVNVPLDTNKTGVNAPVKRAVGGDSDIEPLWGTLGGRTEQVFRAIARNSFGIELMNTIGAEPVKSAPTVDEMIDMLDTQDDLAKPGTVATSPTFTVFQNGERVEFPVTEDMFDALKPANKILAYRNKHIQAVGNIRRNLLTTWSPLFALYKNPVKDIQDVAINSQHAMKTYMNVPVAMKEIVTNGKYAREYHQNGGKGGTYFDSKTNTFSTDRSLMTKLVGLPVKPFEYVGEFIEELPRLAEYIASRKEGRSIERSMLDAARVTTNFAAGGDFTKFLNSLGCTFLNASVQGPSQHVRNFREAKQQGVKGYVKLLAKYTIAGVPTIILNSMIWDDDDEYEELSDYVKQNYYVVAKTDDGKFIRIPKGRTAAVIGECMEQMENLVTGDDEVDFNTFFELFMNNIAPNNPIENNILAPLIQAHTNRAWYGDDIVPGRLQDLPMAEQFDESTDSFSKWFAETPLGDALNISPVRLNYLIDQYSGALGDMFLPMMTPEAESGDDTFLGNVRAPWKKEMTTDMVLNSGNAGDFFDMQGELEILANSRNATDEDTLRALYMENVGWELSALYAEKREVQNSDLSDSEKFERIREIQEQINDLAEHALNSYNDIFIDGVYAEVDNQRFNQSSNGQWYELSEDYDPYGFYEREQKVTKAFDISYADYWNNRDAYNTAYTVTNYNGAFETVRTVFDMDYYVGVANDLAGLSADKDEYGNSISGSKKRKVIEYIDGLDIGEGERYILFKTQYPADDTYNYEIIDYLNNRDDISYQEMVTILEELDFEVDDEGYITW